MAKGTASIKFGDSVLDLGIVTTIQDNFNMSVSLIKIPTLPAEKAFAMDAGTTEEYSLSFERGNPPSPNDKSTDSTDWSNAKWTNKLIESINRWQMRTDGCTFRFVPESSQTLGEIEDNCYIASISIAYNAGIPEKVGGTMKLKVGTMYMSSKKEPTIAKEDMFITISSTNGDSVYYLMSEGINLVKNYRIKGGLEQPFEYMTIVIPKKRLSNYMSLLGDSRGIVAGRNVITVYAYGFGQFVVTKCKLSADEYHITAYSIAEAFRGAVTSEEYNSDTWSPYRIIVDILDKGLSIGDSVNINYSGERGNFITNADVSKEWSDKVVFPKGSNCWYVLQVCAMRLGTRIFFAEDKAYLIDTMKSDESIVQYGNINLYPETTNEEDLAKNIVGNSKLGDEGSSTVVNTITIQYNNTEKVTVNSLSLASRDTYGIKSGGTLSIKELSSIKDATLIALYYMDMLTDSQTSIGFTVKELTNKGWVKTFEPLSCADSIQDEDGDETITNIAHSTGKKMQNLLMLSTFERKYPEGVSEYWWGIQQKADLTQAMSQIQSALNN